VFWYFLPVTAKKAIFREPVSHFKGEFSISRDTLIIAERSGSDYTIDRRSAFQKIRNGKVKPVELKSSTFLGEYDDKQQRIITYPEGKVFTFGNKKGILLLGKREYKKID
jgi:hypothetical protein